MKKISIAAIAALPLLLLPAGCTKTPSPAIAAAAAPESGSKKINAAAYLLDQEPDGAMGVIDVREAGADEQEEVVVVGRVGGCSQPFVAGRAAFTLVDASIELCQDGDACPCCQEKVQGGTVFVKVVDPDGRVLAADAREIFRLKGHEMIVVRGASRRDEAGNVTVHANGVYVRR